MVVSKRCKICAVLDPKNVSILGDYYGSSIPDLIQEICGIELDPRKANTALICQACTIQFLHMHTVVVKMRNSLQRLRKIVKQSKPRTPFKNSAATPKGKHSGNDEDMLDKTCESDQQSSKEEEKSESKSSTKPVKKVARRKSIFVDEKDVDNAKRKINDEELPNSAHKKIFKKFVDDDTAIASTTPKAVKRKLTPLIDGTLETASLNGAAAVDISNSNCNKTRRVSLSENALMDLTADEQNESADGYKQRVLNCILCGNMFNSKSALRIHIEREHEGEQLKACPNCSLEFRSLQKYESHTFNEKCKNAQHVCQYPNCNKRFKTATKMQLHMEEKHSLQKEFGSE